MTQNEQAAHNLLGIGLMIAAMAILPFLDLIAKMLGRDRQNAWAA